MTAATSPSSTHQPHFLTPNNPSNPAQLKRTVLASFTDILLLPVTIVPRTVGVVGGVVGGAVMKGGRGAVAGVKMLNPQRWASSGNGAEGYSKNLGNDGTLFEVGEDEDDEKEGEDSKPFFLFYLP